MRREDQTVWLTQRLMAELFQGDVRTINEHIQNILDEGELLPDQVIRKFRITADDGELDPQATVKQHLIVQSEGAR